MTEMNISNEPLSREFISIALTPNINNFLKDCVYLKLLIQLPDGDSFDLDELMNLVQKYNSSREGYNLERVNMNQLLKDSFINDRKHVPTEAAHKLSHIELIRRRAQERSYQNMIGNTHIEKPTDSLTDYKRSIALGVNLLLGIFLTFLAGYWGLLYFGFTSVTTRAVVGMIFSILCLVVEVVLFLIRDARELRIKANKNQNSFTTQKQNDNQNYLKYNSKVFYNTTSFHKNDNFATEMGTIKTTENSQQESDLTSNNFEKHISTESSDEIWTTNTSSNTLKKR